MGRSTVRINTQPLILKEAGQKPTVPNNINALPGDIGWRDTDILLGQHAYNVIDNKYYGRSLDGIYEIISISDPITSTIEVGGIPAQRNFTKSTPIEDILKELLVKYKSAEIVEYPSISVIFNGRPNYYEIGKTLTTTNASTTSNRGRIKNANFTADTPIKGPVISSNFIGADNNGIINKVITKGDNIFSYSVTFSEGTDPYVDSTGAYVHIPTIDAQRAQETLTVSKNTIGIYPIYWGMSTTDLSVNPELVKDKLIKKFIGPIPSTISLPFNGDASYVYVAVPSGYKITEIIDVNDFPQGVGTSQHDTFVSYNVLIDTDYDTNVEYNLVKTRSKKTIHINQTDSKQYKAIIERD